MAEDKELQDLLDWIKNLPEGITDKKDANKKIAQIRSIAVHVDQTIAKLLNKAERTTTRLPLLRSASDSKFGIFVGDRNADGFA